MTADIDNLIRLNKSHIKAAADVLIKAFSDYPLYVYFFPDASERIHKLSYMLHGLVRYGVLYGEVYTTSPNLEGVSIWLPSDRVEPSLWRMAQSGWFSIALKMGVSSIGRMMRFANYSTAVHKRHAPDRHSYFQLLGVDPAYQRKGYAGVLINPMIARMDREQLPCYLETHKQENVPIFQRYGFKVVEEGIIPKSRTTQWAMLRENIG